MRKILVSIILFLLIALGSVFTIRHTHDIPYGSQQVEVITTPPVDEYSAELTSAKFKEGYQDAQKGITTGVFEWIMSNEYRVGHMLGTHDKKKNIKRYN